MASSLLSFTVTRIVAAKHIDDTFPVLNEDIKTLLTLLSSVQEEQRNKEKKSLDTRMLNLVFCRIFRSLHHIAHTNHLIG